MYEAGPQVLSPVRKPNQVDTVTWDVTREFLHPLASFHSTYPLSRLLSSFPACLRREVDFQCPSLEGHSPADVSANNETIFLPIYLPFHRFRLRKKKSTSTGGENNTVKAPFLRSLFVVLSAGRDQEKKAKAGM